MRRGCGYAVRLLAMVVVYSIAGSLALSLHSLSGVAPLVWAPSAIGLSLVLVYGPRWWPGVALGTLVILTLHHVPLWPALGIAATDVFEVLLGCALLYGVLRFRPDLDRIRDVVAFILVSAGISLISATSSVAILLGAGMVGLGHFDNVWWSLWWSHLSGDLIVAPAILTCSRPLGLPRGRAWRPVEAASLAVIVLIVVFVVLGRAFPVWLPAADAPYYLLPILIWAGVRFGPRGAALASLGATLSAIVVNSFGVGPFERLIDLQSFVAVSTVSTLAISALAVERLQAVERRGAIELAALDAIITVDELGHVVELNPAAEALFQIHEREVEGKDIAALVIPPRLRALFRRGLREFAHPATAVVVGGRYRTTAWRASDKAEFPVEIAVARTVVDGRPLFTGFVRDISAELHAHEKLELQVNERTAALREANQALERHGLLMRQAEELAHLGSFEHELQSGTIKWSDELYRIFGREPGAPLTFDSFFESVHPDDRGMMKASIDKAVAKIEQFMLVHRIVRPDGTIRTLQTHGRLDAAADGKPLRVIGCCQDITEREESDLVRSRLVQIVESSDDAIIGLAPDGTIASWNRAAARLFGYDAKAVIGRPSSILLPRERAPRLGAVLAAVRSGEHVARYDLTHLRRDGSTFEGSVTTSAVFDGKGNVVGISKVLRDVTKQKDVEDRLRASLREKDVLLREIHHRVKNNLQVIASLLNIQMTGEADAGARQGLVESQNRIQSMALVHQLLYQSKDLARIDFGEYLKNVTDRLAQTYDSGGDRIQVTVKAPPFRLDIDHAIPCGLIVNELVTNALTHAFPDGRKGSIEVTLQADADAVKLAVADDGVGIDERIRIADVQTFGLRIARTLTKQLGGTLAIERGNGTTVRVQFPLAKGPPQIT